MQSLMRLLNLVVVAAAFATTQAGAQTTQTYAYENNTFAWDTPTGSATTVVWDSTNGYCSNYDNSPNSGRPGDDVKAEVAFPGSFTFTFAGTAYSAIRIMSNGMLQFGTDAGFHRDYTPQALPVTASADSGGTPAAGCPIAIPTNILFAYWRDIDAARNITGSVSAVKYELLGSAPNRRFVITYQNVYLYGQNVIYNFQVVLYEGKSASCSAIAPTATECNNGDFEFRYTNGSSDGSNATVGVQLSTTDYTQYAFDQAFIDTVNGTNIHWYPAPPAAQAQLDAEYRFDETLWNGTQNEARDTSGKTRHGVRMGSAVTSGTTFKICRSAQIPSNTTATTRDGVALGNPSASTGYSPSRVGSATFFYLPNANSTNTMLFDATLTANRPFYIMRTSGNEIKVGISDSAGTILTATSSGAAVTTGNGWRHIAVSWKLNAGTNASIIQIFINGTLNTVARGTTTGTIATYATPACAGDNCTNNVTPSGGTANSANGYLDEMRFYPAEVSVVQARYDYLATRPSCNVLDHFNISIAGTTGNSGTIVSALTCETVGVQITARDISNNLVTLAGDASLTATPAHGTWSVQSGSGTSNFTNQGNGQATFTFNNTSTVTLQFNDRIEETVNLNISYGGIAEAAGADPSISFTHEGLKFVKDTSGTALAAGDLDASSCTNRTLYLRAMKTDLSTFSCVANTGATGKTGTFINGGNPTISLAMRCNDPTSCLSTSIATAGGVALAKGASNAVPVAANYADVPMTVANNNAVAQFSFRYADTGKIQLYASYNAADSKGLTSPGVSPQMIVGPNGFAFCNVKNATGTANPGTSTLAGDLFARAGEKISTDIWALSCGDPASVCGTYADVAACVSAKQCAGNFGQESTPPSSNKHGGGTFSMGGSLVAPLPSPAATDGTWVNPTLVAAPSFTSGGTTGTQFTWKEVGAMQPTLKLSGFFGSTLDFSGGGTTVGRFSPYQYTISASKSCNTFTYSGQPFTGSVTAQATDGSTTKNFDSTAAFSRTVTVSDSSAAAGSFANNSLADTAFAKGVGAFPAVNGANPIKWTFTGVRTPPATLTLIAKDASDEQAATPSANFDIRSGRARLLNANGSNLQDLPVPFRTEYWAGIAGNQGWQLNTADTCSDVSVALVSGTLDVTGTPPNTCVVDTGSPGRSGAGCSGAGTPASRQFLKTGAAGFAGDFNLWLKAPPLTVRGSVKVNATVPAWLQFNWTGSVGNPSATATFGSYDRRRVIQVYERY